MKIRVGSKGTIVIPEELRAKAGIAEGDILEISMREKAIVVVKDMKWQELHGCARGIKVEEVEKELDEAEKLWEKRSKRWL